jgi:Radical SAM superfamily
MKRTRVAYVGHVIEEPAVISIGRDPVRVGDLVRPRIFTRVFDDGLLYEHLAYLGRSRPDRGALSIWQMWLCSTLLMSAHLERHGFEVLATNYIDCDNRQDHERRLRDFAPDIVFLSTTFILSSAQFLACSALVRELVPGALLVCGGQHIFTALHDKTAQERGQYLLRSRADVFVNDSQGEAAALALCQAFPDRISEVPNLVIRNPDGTASETRRVHEANEIDSTPLALDRVAPGDVVHLRTARSCAFKCEFCSYPTVAGALALMDLDLVMATLRRCRDAGVRAIFFVDDTFNVPRPRFEQLIDRMLAEGLNIPWYSFLRCQFVDRELVRKMRACGCAGVFLGIESGSDAVLKNMRKGARASAYRDAITWLRDEGIITVGSFVLGFPGETQDSVAVTQDFITRAGLDYYYIQPFYYLHHAPVHQKAERFSLRGNGLFWAHATMTYKDALRHIERLFTEIDGPIWVNPDYTLWEVAYLAARGFSRAEIDDHRRIINRLTRDQLTAPASTMHVTSRDHAG